MSSLSASCGRCFKPVCAASGGVILSCSDFLCPSCCRMCTSPNGQLSCSACGKRGVNSIDIGDPNLIEEVKENLSDVAIAAQKIQDTATFQIKHYKLTIKRMLAKIVQLSKDNAIYKKKIEELTSGNIAGYLLTEASQQRTQQVSLNSMLTNSIPPAMQPPERPPNVNSRPLTSIGGRIDNTSILGKRPDTSQETQFSGRATHSQHFATPSAQPDYKRVQTASARMGPQPGPSGAQGGRSAAGGSFQRAVEVSRPAAGSHQLPQPPHLTYPSQPSLHAQQAQQWHPEHVRDSVDRGFGPSAAPPAPTVTPVSSQAPSAASYQQARPHTMGGALGSHYAVGTTADFSAQQQPIERTSTPTNMGRPPSASKSPSFATPSRLRSPHPTIPRTSSGGTGRPGSRGHLANPMHGVGVSISQNQMHAPQSALQGYLHTSGAYNMK